MLAQAMLQFTRQHRRGNSRQKKSLLADCKTLACGRLRPLADESATRGVSPPRAPPTSPSTVKKSQKIPQNTKLKARHRLKSAASKNIPDRVRERVPVRLGREGHDVPPRRLGHGA